VTERLPDINACLNFLSLVLLSAGYRFIRAKDIFLHRACMAAAFAVSLLFMASYLTYHARAGSVPFHGQGWIRPVYFGILISHSILAALVPPLAVAAITRAWKGNIPGHVRLVRFLFPAWVYVSATGIAVYWMAYRMSWA